jgi:hypothetical protein
MKGIYLTTEAKQEIEAKIVEIIETYYPFPEGEKKIGQLIVYEEILSSATILPVEESWENVKDMLSINTLPISYKQGVIIQPK